MPNKVTTLCPMNCHPTYCGMRVTVAEDRVLRIDGDPDNPDSRGFLCIRGRAAIEIRDNPRRLLTPLRRVGPRGAGRWEPIAWDTALATIADAIRATDRRRVGIWMGHGASATGLSRQLTTRFGNLGGFQVWNPAVVCWALGAYGLGLTGVLETNTKEDLAANARTILMWGANLSSQPTTAPHLVEARRRGARVVVIDCRRTEAARHADEVYLVRPGTDAALALALAHVIDAEGLCDEAFLARHTIGAAEFRTSLRDYTPEWAAPIVGLAAEQIRALARTYATAKPAMIVLGGSSIFKHEHGWEAGRAIACLPALTGQLGIAGGGFGPRHRGFTRGEGLADISAHERRPAGPYLPTHMPTMVDAFARGAIDTLLLFGTNMVSSFADAGALERALERIGLIVVTDIFESETIRRTADIVLPGAAWLEEIGLKDTATHLYLMEQALPPAGEARPIGTILRNLAERLDIPDFFPWPDAEGALDAWLAGQTCADGTPLTLARLRAAGGRWERGKLSHIAYPDLRFHTPSGKVELWSERAEQVGLPALPGYTPGEFSDPGDSETARWPLQLGQGRTLTAFHSFYDQGRALPSLARANPHPELWVHSLDAQARGIADGARARIHNDSGSLVVVVRVTDDVRPGVVWMRDGWYGMNHLTSGAPALTPEASGLINALLIPGGQAGYHARVDVQLHQSQADMDISD